mmetsp:Transcript_7955/g.16575  ORF Transcript_7955/g.16575 Transcript_7955/m.16575 type:complete len:141 (-) Transcript_7955:1291-1713(-)
MVNRNKPLVGGAAVTPLGTSFASTNSFPTTFQATAFNRASTKGRSNDDDDDEFGFGENEEIMGGSSWKNSSALPLAQQGSGFGSLANAHDTRPAPQQHQHVPANANTNMKNRALQVTTNTSAALSRTGAAVTRAVGIERR